MTSDASYDLHEHRHRFAVWAAARASQRGFTTVQNLREALESTSIRQVLRGGDAAKMTAADFDAHHRRWCTAICASLSRQLGADVPYGRAAKLVAVYLKALVVMGEGCDTPLGCNLHPPIDRILLQTLAGSGKVTSVHQRHWRTIKWTQLDEAQYYELIEQLRAVIPAGAPFWTIEEFWEPSDIRDAV